MLNRSLYIARKDLAYTFKDRSTVIWIAVMPALFFYFIGTATGGFGSPGSRENIAVKIPADAGFLADQLLLRLDQAGLNVVSFAAEDPAAPVSGGSPEIPWDGYCRKLSLPSGLSAAIRDGDQMLVEYETCREALGGDFDQIRVQRAVYTTLADIIAVGASGEGLTADAVAQLNAMDRPVKLAVRPAGKRREPPEGFQQAVPGTMVMFTLILLLTTAAVDLLIERKRGLLRRLASAPMTKRDVVFGKWLGKMALAVCQIVIAMAIGALLFDVRWQPDLPMILLLLIAWAGLCTSAALLLASLGRTEGQVTGVGILVSMVLAGLGGCWWPIEVAPAWMQTLAGFLPTGWTMNALHRLMSFEAGAWSALNELLALSLAAVVLGFAAVRFFRYE